MKPNRITWTTFFLLSLIGLALWFKFSYPQLAIANFSIDQRKAFAIAEDYIVKSRTVDLDHFKKAAVFRIDKKADRYLQKTLGFGGLQEFIKKHDFDLFFWLVRFFKENDKEEFLIEISSASGEVIGFTHVIDDNEARRKITRDEGREKGKEFLQKTFKGFNPDKNSLRSNFATNYDNRSDYKFSWQKKNISIPWNNEPDTGTGKLLTQVIVSGDEILQFSKNRFLVPEQFTRDIDNRKEPGRNIMLIIQVIVLALLTYGIFLIITRQNHLSMQTTKKFYIRVVLISLVLSLLGLANQFHNILFDYKTEYSFSSYLYRNGINMLVSSLFLAVAMLIPGFAGELLHFETSSENPKGSFLHNVRSTFFSRSVAESVALGYFVFFIMLGMQSSLIKFGQSYLGVWVEHSWIDNISTAYLPFLAAFTLGYKASFSEEMMYRLYAINLGKRLFNKFKLSGTQAVFITVIISSLIWGFAHSSYSVFPVWFRGLEVSCIGFFLAFIYIKFGLIPVIVAHFVFDVFWNCAGYIFGISTPFYFYSSVFVFLLPLGFALTAFVLNKREEERPLRWQLNKHQTYNLEILKSFLNTNKNIFIHKEAGELRNEIISHGWDPAVVEVALENFYGSPDT